MLIDCLSLPDLEPAGAEALIIGSGAVGLSMAVDLARAGRKVTVLEAGGKNVDPQSQSYFESAKWGQFKLEGLHLGRFRALGGTTNFWGGQVLPFDPNIFESRPWVADVSWPITRSDLEPFYQRAYRLLGLGHLLSDSAVLERLKLQPLQMDNSLKTFFSAWVPQPNFARLFKDEIDKNKNLCVVVNAPVISLKLNDSGSRVEAIFVRNLAGNIRRFVGQQIILANGTIEIARLLKLQLQDGSAAPWHDNQWLGKGFVDHLDCVGGMVTPIDRRRFHNLFDNAFLDGIKYTPKVKLSEHMQTNRSLLSVAAHFIFKSDFSEHLANTKILANALLRGRRSGTLKFNIKEILNSVRVALPMVHRYMRYRRMYNPTDQGIELRITSEQLPLAQSALHLLPCRDSLGMPTIKMDWQIDGREIETMASFGELVAAQFEKEKLAHIQLDVAMMGRQEKFLQDLDDANHHMGMARMAFSPASGVVDSNLRVFGTDNLYVVGAAVYPTTGFPNPTFTAIALGLRLADRIRNEKIVE